MRRFRSLGPWLAILAALPSLSMADTFRDPRDGRVYPLVHIGGMAWFAENLDYALPGSYCYDDDEANCRKHGRLYRWEHSLAVCPPGSHLSSEYEWQALERAVGLPEVEVAQRRNRGTVEGARLKPGGDTGWNAQYSGWRRYETGTYRALDANGAWWTSTETDVAHAQHRDIDVGDDQIWRSPVVKHYALSVRCVVDRYFMDEYEGDDAGPAVSPDGSYLAYVSSRQESEFGHARGAAATFEVYLMDLALKEEKRLTTNGASERDLAWSPDGSTLALVSDADGNDEIHLLSLDGELTTVASHPASDRSPSFTGDGNALIFASDRDGAFDLYRAALAGGSIERLTDHPGADHSPAVSPDGRRVAFVSDRTGNEEIFLLDLGTGDLRRATNSPGADLYPAWAPGGESLLVIYREGGEWSLVRVALDGSEPELLFEGVEPSRASSRPDGTIAFAAPWMRTDGPRPGRIFLGVAGGAGPQLLTGRLAGTYGDRRPY